MSNEEIHKKNNLIVLITDIFKMYYIFKMSFSYHTLIRNANFSEINFCDLSYFNNS